MRRSPHGWLPACSWRGYFSGLELWRSVPPGATDDLRATPQRKQMSGFRLARERVVSPLSG